VAFPDLALRPYTGAPGNVATHWAEAVGVPDNGNNTFLLPFVDEGIAANRIDENWLEIDVDPLGPSVTAVAEGVPLLSADKRFMTLNFTQTGADTARVRVQLIKTDQR